MQKILRTLGKGQLIDIRELHKKIVTKDEAWMKQFYSYYKKYAKMSNLTYQQFFDRIAKQDSAWVFSKFIGTQLIDVVEKNNIMTDFISGAVLYASSQSKLSGPFAILH